jgi:membrane protease YdiL (CAAX protease family)
LAFSDNPSSVDPSSINPASMNPELEPLPLAGDVPVPAGERLAGEHLAKAAAQEPAGTPTTATNSDPLDLVRSIPPPVIVIPPRDPVWSGWDVLIVAVLTVVTIVVCSFALALTFHWLAPRVNVNAVAPEIAVGAQLVAYLVMAAFMIMLVEGKYRVNFWKAIRWNWPRSNFKFLALGVALLLTINVVAHFLPMPKTTPFDQFFLKSRDAVVMSIFAVTLGPLMEELFFRGLLYPVLVRRIGVFWGIILTALPFGLLHMFQYGYSWALVLLIFLMGVVCTVVRWKTESVGASFLVHVGYNGTEMFLLMLATDGFRHMEKALG